MGNYIQLNEIPYKGKQFFLGNNVIYKGKMKINSNEVIL